MNGISARLILYVTIGGVIGALLRYAVTQSIRPLPGEDIIGTVVANISGTFLLGLFAAFTARRTSIEPDLRMGVMIGLFGSYTTLSALSYQTVSLVGDGHLVWAALYSTGSLLLGLVAVAAGTSLGKR